MAPPGATRPRRARTLGHFKGTAAGTRDAEGAACPSFHEAPAPTKDDVALVARRVRDRAVRWLGRKGYIDERAAEDRSNESPEPSALEACTQLALAGGAFLARPGKLGDDPDADLDRKERRFSATYDGFDVHCAVRIEAGDDQGRERLVRYCTRPPFALDRIEVLRDGRIAYRVKTARRGHTHRVMMPMEFMARIAVLIPPSYIPMVRYHGVFASRSTWRPLVTPKPPTPAVKPKPNPTPCSASTATSTPAPAPGATPAPAPPTPVPSRAPAPTAPALAPTVALPPAPTPAPAGHAHAPVEPVVVVDPTTISVAHWGRLSDGELFARSRYVEWAVLMKRTWGLAVLTCPRCGRKMRVLSTLTDPQVVRKLLEHLGVRSSPLPRLPARDPSWDQTELGFGAA